MKNDYSKILSLSKELGIPVNKIAELFWVLKDGNPIENDLLVQKIGVSKNVLNQIKKNLSIFFNPVSPTTCLNNNGISYAGTIIEDYYKSEDELLNLSNSPSFLSTISLLEKYETLRPTPNRNLDQFSATLETVGKRAAIMDFFSDIRGKRILFLGDDDLTSVAVANLKKADEIVVLDIDLRILDVIKKIAKKENLTIKTMLYDARKTPIKDFVGKFDVVFTDPPYSSNGINLFTSRAIQYLDINNKAGRIYICYGNSDRAKERYLPVFEIFNNSGLVARWIFDKFNRYKGAESIGSASALYILEVTPATTSLIKGDYKNENIYTV